MEKYSGLIKDIIPKLLDLEQDKVYICEIKKPRSMKSYEQLKKFWKLIHLIASKTYQDDMDVYCGILEKADVKSDYVITATEMIDNLRAEFRGARFVKRQIVNDKDCYVYKVYLGCSKMDMKEMWELTDVALNIAASLGIPTERDYEK